MMNPDDWDDWEEKAFAFAKDKHRGQEDDSGKSYFEAHIVHVVSILRQVTTDPDILTAAYLHDTLEDTATTFHELADTFGNRVAGLVYEVTHEGDKDSYGYYFPHLKSKDAIIIKFADRLSNLSRMEPWNESRQAQYLRKSKFWKDGTDRR